MWQPWWPTKRLGPTSLYYPRVVSSRDRLSRKQPGLSTPPDRLQICGQEKKAEVLAGRVLFYWSLVHFLVNRNKVWLTNHIIMIIKLTNWSSLIDLNLKVCHLCQWQVFHLLLLRTRYCPGCYWVRGFRMNVIQKSIIFVGRVLFSFSYFFFVYVLYICIYYLNINIKRI